MMSDKSDFHFFLLCEFLFLLLHFLVVLLFNLFEGLGGHGELVTRREDIIPAVKRAMASGKTACVNVKVKGVISPIVLATTSKRDKASIE